MSFIYRSGHQPALHQASLLGSLDPQSFPFHTQSGNVSNLNHKMLNKGRQGGRRLCTMPEYSQKTAE